MTNAGQPKQWDGQREMTVEDAQLIELRRIAKTIDKVHTWILVWNLLTILAVAFTVLVLLSTAARN